MTDNDYSEMAGDEAGQEPVRHRRRDYFVLPAWAWPIVGLVFILAGLALGWVLFRSPPDPPEETPAPTTAVAELFTATPQLSTETPSLTATAAPTQFLPSATPTMTPLPTNTPLPTATPTPELEVAVGGRVQVVGTAGTDLRLRAGPGQDYVTFKLLEDGTVLEVIGGPEEGDGFLWWRLKDNTQTIGWAAEEWLEPIP